VSLLLRNGRLPGGDVPVDVHLVADTIAAVGPGLVAAQAEVLDLDGRVIVPGLWDQHVHLTQTALARQRIDLAPAESAAHAAAIVRAHLDEAGAPGHGMPLVGAAFRDGLWPDAPDTALLDEAAGRVPVVLVSADLHSCWLNTAAAEKFAVAPGLHREDDCFAIVRALDDVPPAVLDSWVAAEGRRAAARGVVGVVDLEMRWNADDWIRRAEAGFDSVRVRFGVYPQHLDRAIERGLGTGRRLAPLVEVGPLKVITDGSLNTRTAYCVDAYPGLDSRGLLTVPPGELEELLATADAAGLVPAVHAIGDDANRLALDVFEKLGVRGRIEHAQLLRSEDVPRFAALGVTASVQPEHALDDRDVADRHWAGRTDRAFVLRSLVEAGATVVLGSDSPVAPLDPWIAIAAATARTRDGRAPWHPEQSLDVATALACSTDGVAELAVGGVGDIAVLDADPNSVDATALRTMPVGATIVAGRVTHTRL
jgi:predicted amidohydrolase YtcJ